MSGTRSACPRAPVTELRPKKKALLVCSHGGTSSPMGPHQVRVGAAARRAGFDYFGNCSLYGTPSLEETALALQGFDIVTVPYFLCNGVTLNALKDRVGRMERRAKIAVCPVLGSHSVLPQRVTEFARSAVEARHWGVRQTALLFVAHGSKRNDSAKRMVDALATTVTRISDFGEVRYALLEEPPSVSDALRGIVSRKVVVVGCFMEAGWHAMHDVPQLLNKETRTQVYLGAIGQTAWMNELAVVQALEYLYGEEIRCLVASV